MEQLEQKEIKQFWAEVRASGPRKIKGRIMYNVLSEDLGGFQERLLPGSLKPAANTFLLWSHDAGKPLASTKSGTLKLRDTAERA
jgi:phage head maturation protease